MSIHLQEPKALLTNYEITSAYSEAYYTLFANIRFNWKSAQEEPSAPHTLLITTPTPFAAAATVAANVAIAAAQSEIATILVDANLRTGNLEQQFGLEQRPGLRDLLAEEHLSARTIETYLTTTFIRELRLLGAGTASNEPFIIQPAKLQELVENIRQFMLGTANTQTPPGIIIFNGPAVLSGPDASLLASLAEQTVVTIVKGRTTRTQARHAQEQLQRAHAQLVGIILMAK